MLSESATGVMKVYTAQGNTSRPITENKDITPLPTVLLKIEILSFQYADFITTGIQFFFFCHDVLIKSTMLFLCLVKIT